MKEQAQIRFAAFTLVELMVVVAIIGVVAAIILPAVAKSRKQSQGRRVVNDVREMDAAISQWAIDNNLVDGATVDTTAVATYLKKGWSTTDVLGNAYRSAQWVRPKSESPVAQSEV